MYPVTACSKVVGRRGSASITPYHRKFGRRNGNNVINFEISKKGVDK